MATRTQKRKHLSNELRIERLEEDQDENDEALAKVNATLTKIMWTLVGLLISTTTGAILFGLNLAVSS